jgi:hypothetical protein
VLTGGMPCLEVLWPVKSEVSYGVSDLCDLVAGCQACVGDNVEGRRNLGGSLHERRPFGSETNI